MSTPLEDFAKYDNMYAEPYDLAEKAYLIQINLVKQILMFI